jgi:hypothetical protein
LREYPTARGLDQGAGVGEDLAEGKQRRRQIAHGHAAIGERVSASRPALEHPR